MTEYSVTSLSLSNAWHRSAVTALLHAENLRLDENLDYTCGIFDEEMNLIATGSCFANTLRCIAVCSSHRGEGLTSSLITHLLTIQAERGNTHVFLYTKCETAAFFHDLGFFEIARVRPKIVFMENRRNGFSTYLQRLVHSLPEKTSFGNAAIVMNANPFTLGHLSLIERACQENDLVHLFILSENTGPIPFSVRKRLVLQGTSHLSNLLIHDSGPYLISNATFPSYFQPDSDDAAKSHALLDLALFARIAQRLQITARYVGEEPNSHVTALYNEVMQHQLPAYGISCRILPRLTANGSVVSASSVRQLLKEFQQTHAPQCLARLRTLVPASTYHYFSSPEAECVLEQIAVCDRLNHH